MAEVILITGANLGDVASTLERCNEMIELRVGKITSKSNVRGSDAWGFESEDKFLNQVLVVDTIFEPLELLYKLQEIEKILGRDKDCAIVSQLGVKRDYQSRKIDIDILFYDKQVINLPELTVPHVMLPEREFVLEPLCELVSDLIHPLLGRSMWDLRNDLKQRNKI